jgi:ketosteroid isomerase-like protein
MKLILSLIAALSLAGCCTPSAPIADLPALRQQVIETEKAFAHTMAVRDHAGFVTFVSEEATFLSGDKTLRGRKQVADAWKALYEKPEAPFSWEPETVEVLESGKLAISTGPVRDSKGKRFATYTSIWRQESPGKWRIIFDKGDDAK